MSSYLQHLYHLVFRTKDSLPTIEKASSSLWMKSSGLFTAFKGWAVGYGSFTCSYIDIFSSFRAVDGEWTSTPGFARGYSY